MAKPLVPLAAFALLGAGCVLHHNDPAPSPAPTGVLTLTATHSLVPYQYLVLKKN